MNDVAPMAEENNVPPMGGIAIMAIELAEWRNPALQGFWTRNRIPPCDRDQVNPYIHPVSAEYYRIIDRIARGERP